MLTSRNFTRIYSQLQDDDTKSMAMTCIIEHMPTSLEYFYNELIKEDDLYQREQMVKLYNHTIQTRYAFIIQQLLSKDYLSLENIFSHVTSFIFHKEPYSVQNQLQNYAQLLSQRLDKKIIANGNPKEILAEINFKITQSLLLDNSSIGHYDFTEVPNQHIVSQYTLAILILIVAEKLQIPIFGIPFSDKLVLCYTASYCLHNELVTENDILYYAVIGEKDLIYTLEDLKLLAIIQEETLELKAILPHSTERIVEKWLEHLTNASFDAKTRKNLSSIYQQIFSLTEEF